MKKSILVGLAMLVTLSFAACNDDENSTSSGTDLEGKNWAVNDVVEESSENLQAAQTNVNVKPTETTTTTFELPEFKDYVYKSKDDPNVGKIDSFETISIDGKLISFRESYAEVEKKFKLYQEQITPYGMSLVEVDKTYDVEYISVKTTAESGQGTVTLSFASKTGSPDKIDNLILSGIFMSGGNTEGKDVMTICLPGDVKFGDDMKTVSDNIELFGVDEELQDDETTWSIFGTSDENIRVSLYGVDGGLKNIKLACLQLLVEE